jgi:hypothetical protein
MKTVVDAMTSLTKEVVSWWRSVLNLIRINNQRLRFLPVFARQKRAVTGRRHGGTIIATSASLQRYDFQIER